MRYNHAILFEKIMSTVLWISLLVFGIFLSSFVLWLRLKDDYPNEAIFSLTLALFFAGLLGFFVASKFFIKGDFWLPAIFAALFGAYWIRRAKMHFFDILDATSFAFFIFILFLFLAVFVRLAGSLSSLVAALEVGIAFLALVLSLFLLPRYRSFGWYLSGKVGFVGLFGLAVYFGARGILAFFLPPVLSFSSQTLDVALGILILATCIGVLYIRSGRNLREDLATFSSNLRRRKNNG